MKDQLLLVGRVETALPQMEYPLPPRGEFDLTLMRDLTTLKGGSKGLLAAVYQFLDTVAPIVKDDSLITLGSIAKVVKAPVSSVKRVVARACACLRENNVAAEVKHDWSGLRDGVYVTAKRGNRILGVTLNPFKDASIDTYKSVRAGRVDSRQLAAKAAVAGSLNG